MIDAPLSPSHVVSEEIAGLLHELRPQETHPPVVRIDARLDRDLGLDSLSRMELLARLEKRLHVSIPERLALEAQTPADLLRALAASSARTASIDVDTALASARQEPLATPDGASTLPEVLAWHARRHPDRMHVHFAGGDGDGVELSYAELYAAANETACGLQQAGL
ncbi:MAG: phosphopantetheine-binding protein, partial [Chloroflexota bacterium]